MKSAPDGSTVNSVYSSLAELQDQEQHHSQWYRFLVWTPVRLTLLVLAHLAIFSVAYLVSFQLRFDFRIPAKYQEVCWKSLPLLIALQSFCFFAFRAFSGWWRYFTFRDLVSLAQPLVCASILFLIVDVWLHPLKVPKSIHLINLAFAGIIICSLRSVWRLSRESQLVGSTPTDCESALIICNKLESLIAAHQINNRPGSRIRIKGILSDHRQTIGHQRAGMKIMGRPTDAPRFCRQNSVGQVLVFSGEMSGRQIKQLKEIYDEAGISLKVIPESIDTDSGNGRIPLREIDIKDLLQREPVDLNTALIANEIEGSRVLITGAGGSIGSELCRQVLQFKPAEMILLDHRENSVFMIHNELKQVCGETILIPAVGDILDEQRMDMLFQENLPQFVYHAAAHKHVGLMETNISEAVKNNVLGTKRIAETCDRYDVCKFVLISTDKAVNPTSVMGCTKNLAERIVLSLAETSETQFVIVRFGNVLGSNGSVVPIFKEQIAAGGPVTVTDARMTRFFMTIPEASQLVLQAASMGDGGEIFVLDMGEQVRIIDLAKQMIRLAGLPEDSIEIEIVGMRKGEKLFEELHCDVDQLLETKHPKINAAYQPNETWVDITNYVDQLTDIAHGSPQEIRLFFKQLIPEYRMDSNEAQPLRAVR